MNSRVVIATVAESCDPYITEVKWLFYSLRIFGGNLSNARCVVYFVNQLPDDLSAFRKLDIDVKLVHTLDSRYPHCNKIHMLLDETRDYDWLVALDSDIIIMDDFSEHLTGNAVAAKIVDQNPLEMSHWQKMFNHFGLKIPGDRYLSHFHCQETIPYFNSGVIFIPSDHVSGLGLSWKEMLSEIQDLYQLDEEIAKHKFFTDQFAFILALIKTNTPYRALPLELNFPTHLPVHSAFNPNLVHPLLLHHHHQFTSENRILSCCYENVNRLIERFNQSLQTL